MDQFKNIPAFKFALLFAAGILIGSKHEINILYLITAYTIFFLAVVFVSKYRSDIFNMIIISCLIVSFGIFKANLDFFDLPENNISKIPDTKRKSNYELIGVISEIPYCDSSKIRFVLESEVIVTKYDSVNVTGEVIVTIRKNNYTDKNDSQPTLHVGNKVSLLGKLTEAFSSRNPGEFDYKHYLRLHDIYKTFLVFGYNNIEVISKENLGFFYQEIIYPSKIFALKNIDEYVGGDEGAYLKGLVTGERSDLSKELKQAFINTGVMHLIAVSGLNVAYIIISITLILSLIRLPQIPKTTITIIALIFYCLFTGSPASIVRATIMGILFLIAIILERKTYFYNIVGVSALIILIYDSKQLFDPGFILSYCAVITMVFFYERFEKLLAPKINEWDIKGKKYIRYMLVLFLTTLAAQIGTLPITATFFGKISFISLLANLFVVPIANIALAIGFFQIIISIVSPFLSSVIAESNNILLSIQLWFIRWCASFDFAYIEFYKFNLFYTIIYFLILLLLFTATRKNVKYRILLSVLIFSAAVLLNLELNKKLRVTFLDVGQGDCAVIQTPDDKTIIVDCGIKSLTYDSGERTIAPYLKRNGISRIDLLILTHYHLDHVGGVEYLLENFEVDKIFDNGQRNNSNISKTIDNLVIAKKITRLKIKSGSLIDGIEKLRIYFLYPEKNENYLSYYSREDNQNNESIVCKLKYKDVDILFTGDIEEEVEEPIQKNYSNFIESDILKVAHHGSSTSSTIPFLVKSKPEYSIISCGTYNKFNHPSVNILNRLENISSKVLRTDMQGAIIIESDGFDIEVVEWR